MDSSTAICPWRDSIERRVGGVAGCVPSGVHRKPACWATGGEVAVYDCIVVDLLGNKTVQQIHSKSNQKSPHIAALWDWYYLFTVSSSVLFLSMLPHLVFPVSLSHFQLKEFFLWLHISTYELDVWKWRRYSQDERRAKYLNQISSHSTVTMRTHTNTQTYKHTHNTQQTHGVYWTTKWLVTTGILA